MRVLDPGTREQLARASGLFRARRMAEAVVAYQVLLALIPELPDSWFNLAIAQRSLGRPEDSLASLDAALLHRIEHAEEVHLHRAILFAEDLYAPQAAKEELEKALLLAPRYAPAWLNLGNLYEDGGDRAAAKEAYARALDIAPDNTLALARLTGVSEISGDSDPLLKQLRNRLSDRELQPLDRADLGFALGEALDRIGDYDAAFQAYVSANAASRVMGVAYDPEMMEAYVDRAIVAFPIGGVAKADVSDFASPVFVCGMYRSGSTLVEQILVRQGGFVAGGELGAIPSAIDRYLRPYPEAAASCDATILAAIRNEYHTAVARFRPAVARSTDKRPDNVLHIGLIKRIFSDARIVHTVRDPLDNCLSVYFLHAGPKLSYATDLRDVAHYQRQVARLMAHWTSLYPGAVHIVDYDRLVADPTREIAALLDFTGIGGVVPEAGAAPAPVRTASHWQVRKPLYQSSSGRWRNYRSQLVANGMVEEEAAMEPRS